MITHAQSYTGALMHVAASGSPHNVSMLGRSGCALPPLHMRRVAPTSLPLAPALRRIPLFGSRLGGGTVAGSSRPSACARAYDGKSDPSSSAAHRGAANNRRTRGASDPGYPAARAAPIRLAPATLPLSALYLSVCCAGRGETHGRPQRCIACPETPEAKTLVGLSLRHVLKLEFPAPLTTRIFTVFSSMTLIFQTPPRFSEAVNVSAHGASRLRSSG